jgi:aminoglycoside phosphotransferase (APT) family kinase protein
VTQSAEPLFLWAARCAGGTLEGTPRQLTGGSSSSVWRVPLRVGRRRVDVVARRYDGDGQEAFGRQSVRREAAALARVRGAGLRAPQLIGLDEEGEHVGAPSLVMTKLDGRIDLRPSDPTAWLREMAAVAAEIHAVALAGPPFISWVDLDALEVPTWTRRPELWSRAIATVHCPAPSIDEGFIHHDFQHFNLLWRDGTITGVCDWTWSSRGVADMDVAHERLNLVCLFSVAWAEQFREAYEAVVGRALSAWWDVFGLLNYLPDGWGQLLRHQVSRRVPVEVTHMHERVEDLLALALGRLDRGG